MRSAVLGGGVEVGSEGTNEAGLVGGVPGGVAGDALALVVDIGGVCGAEAASVGAVPFCSVDAGHAGLVVDVPAVGSKALDASSVISGEEGGVAFTSFGGDVPGLVCGALDAGLVSGVPESGAGDAGDVGGQVGR